MPGIPFGKEIYNDDRMFVLYVCKCTFKNGHGDTVATTIYHASAPAEHTWCIVTYRNTARYPAVRVDHFESLDHARAYVERVEPMVPLISLGGIPPSIPLSFEKYVEWKTINQLKEYEYASMYLPGGQNHRETLITPKREIVGGQ